MKGLPNTNFALDRIVVPGRLEAVTTKLHAGSVSAICGPNGAGKSTLLSALAGLIQPQAGYVRLGGTPLDEIPLATRAQMLGYLPQTGEVAWDLSVEALVALGRLPWRGVPTSEAQGAVDEAIAAMDLDPFRSRPVSQLSGGERARALMARVLATRPTWLLADEPLANLDLAHAASLMARLRQQARAGRGVVLVLHDLATAMNHADRVLVLQDGRLVTDGLPSHALSERVIEQVWGIQARWLGEPGAQALSLRAPEESPTE